MKISQLDVSRQRAELARPSAVAALLGAVVGAVTLVGCTSQGHATPGPQASRGGTASTTYLPLPFTADRAAELRDDLATGDTQHVRDAVELPAGKALPPRAVTALKALGSVTFDPSTFTDRRDGTATITALAGAKKWTVFLVQSAGRWLISASSGTP
jgi:hypothetical protein